MVPVGGGGAEDDNVGEVDEKHARESSAQPERDQVRGRR